MRTTLIALALLSALCAAAQDDNQTAQQYAQQLQQRSSDPKQIDPQANQWCGNYFRGQLRACLYMRAFMSDAAQSKEPALPPGLDATFLKNSEKDLYSRVLQRHGG